MVAIIDYNAGNLKSVEKALSFIGEESIITGDYHEILCADKVILPGVGAFGSAMEQIKRLELHKAIEEVTEKGTPFLGICLGLQLLFDGSEESEGVEGLHILPGAIKKIQGEPGMKIPHVGWNSLEIKPGATLFQGIPNGAYVYYVHSYYLEAKDPEIVPATTQHGANIPRSVDKGNVFACQFHPEKSSTVGLSLLKNFAGLKGECAVC